MTPEKTKQIEHRLNKISKGLMIGGLLITLGTIFFPIGIIFWIIGLGYVIRGFDKES